MNMVARKNICLLLLCIFYQAALAQSDFFSKVIIWGHLLHTHTHSYIHHAFYRAFQHMGYEVHWVSTTDELADIDLQGALFITEGQVDANMPRRLDCYYILHNWNPENYWELFHNNRCIILQVYTHDCIPSMHEKVGDYMYCNTQEKMICLPWATDLLPDEIDMMKQSVKEQKEPTIYWIGTIGGGIFGNNNEIRQFRQACQENNINFQHIINLSMEKNVTLIQNSYMAPALQGWWQCEKGYIPCRIFKNISYGQWGITNNKTVYDLFQGKIIYNSDTYQLFYDAQKYIKNAPISKLYELMDFVRDNHTYINRIETLLTFMKKALNIKENDELQ
jgi:hypothetical protein